MSIATATPRKEFWSRTPDRIVDRDAAWRRFWRDLEQGARQGRTIIRLTDEAISQALGCSRRTVQYILAKLKALGLIEVYWWHPEHRRRIEITIVLAGASTKDDPPAQAEPTRPTATAGHRGRTGPAPGPPARPTTPEQQARAAAQIAAAARTPEAVAGDPFAMRDGESHTDYLARIKALAASQAKDDNAPAPPAPPPRPRRRPGLEALMAAIARPPVPFVHATIEPPTPESPTPVDRTEPAPGEAGGIPPQPAGP